jgi:flagellar hook-basal body complex protein FliE
MADLSIRAVPGAPAAAAGTPAATRGATGGGFADALSRALDEVNTLQVKAEEGARALAAGTGGDTVETVVGLEKANIAFQLTVQVRNKLLEAYQEIMRLQV